jgi:hypothetical protein
MNFQQVRILKEAVEVYFKVLFSLVDTEKTMGNLNKDIRIT